MLQSEAIAVAHSAAVAAQTYPRGGSSELKCVGGNGSYVSGRCVRQNSSDYSGEFFGTAVRARRLTIATVEHPPSRRSHIDERIRSPLELALRRH